MTDRGPATPAPDGGTADRRLPRHRRLVSRLDFRRVYTHGRRVRGTYLVLVVLPRRRGDSRVGLSVSRQHGGAVRRNKIKRMFREAFRLERAGLPAAVDVVMIPQPHDGKFPLAALRAELRRLLRRAITDPRRRRARPPSRSPRGPREAPS